MRASWLQAHDHEHTWRSRGEAAIAAEMERRLDARGFIAPRPEPSRRAPLVWWTNGTHEVKSSQCPDHWQAGRSTKRHRARRKPARTKG